jgi:transposase
LYDTTSTYFEGKADGNDKAKHGHNKDGHPECRQVVVGLVLDKEGFVNRHEVYEGNRQDITTLTDIVDKLRDKIGDKDNTPTVIVDRGMVSEENLKAIKDRGMNYIVAARHTERDKYLLEFEGLPITEIQKATEGKIEVKIKEIGGDIYILCRSDERAEKDKAIKERFFIKIEEMLLRLQRRIESGRLKDTGKIHEQIGKIKQKNQRVARYYEIKVEETNKFIYLKWNKKETDAGITDGIYLLRTNRRDLTEQEIWKLYMMLTKVERAFRHLKSDLGLRPVYHQNGMRVEGHIFVSVLAYHLLHAIEYSLMAKGDRRSWNTIKQILQSHQAVTVVLPDVDNKHVHHVRLATKPDSEQKEIYDRLGIKMTSIKRKRITIKKAEL